MIPIMSKKSEELPWAVDSVGVEVAVAPGATVWHWDIWNIDTSEKRKNAITMDVSICFFIFFSPI
jgi:hypothetical protein